MSDNIIIGQPTDNVELTFLLVVDERYLMFLLPFVWFSGISHPTATYDFYIVGNCSKDKKTNLISGCQDIVKNKHKNICISLTFEHNINIKPPHYRFLLDGYSRFHPTYCYIGDADIMICENILPFHVERIKNSPYIYCNEVRGYIGCYTKMSGLMFVLAKEFYEQTRSIRQKYLKNGISLGDECMLYDIVNKSNLKIRPSVDSADKFMELRPVHGIHMSLNRFPFKNVKTVCDVLNRLYVGKFKSIIDTFEFLNTMKTYDKDFLRVLDEFMEYKNQSK